MSNGMIGGRLTEVMFEQRPAKTKVLSHTTTWGKRIPHRANSNVPEAGTCLRCLGKSKRSWSGDHHCNSEMTEWHLNQDGSSEGGKKRAGSGWGKAIESFREGWIEWQHMSMTSQWMHT